MGDEGFPQLMLRHLVVYHFMMFHVDRQIVQSTGEQMNLKVNLPAIVSKSAKPPVDGKVDPKKGR